MISLFNRNTDKELEVTISNRTILRILVLVLIFIGVVTALRMMGHAILLIFIAFFLALALNAPVHWIDEHLPGKKHRTRALATIVSALIVLIVLVAFLIVVVPPIVRQVGNFISALPDYVNQFQNHNSAFNQFITDHHLQAQVNNFTNELSGRLHSISGGAVSTLASVGSSLVSAVTVLVLTFMMLVEGPRWVNISKRLLPKKHREHARELSLGMYNVIRGYVNGQVILALIASAFIVPALFILHISYPLALAFVVFICGLIPLIGHTIGAVIITIVALFHSPVSAAIILAYYIFYQQVENYLIQPKLQANTTNMSPLLVFVAVVLGISFGGIFGGLVAIPVMGCIRIFVLDFLTRRNMLDSESTQKEVAKVETK